MYNRNPWVHTLEPDELAAMWERIREIDPPMPRLCAQWWESRTINQLCVLETQAWDCCDKDAYQLARTYWALATAAELGA